MFRHCHHEVERLGKPARRALPDSLALGQERKDARPGDQNRNRPVPGPGRGGGARPARGGHIVVVDDSEVEDDLVRDMTEVLTSMCARLYGKRGATNRAKKALEAADA